MTSLLIATPLYNGTTSYLYTLGALETQRLLKVEVEHVFITGCYIAMNRERLTRFFIEKEHCTHLLFIDSDIGFTANDVFNLLHADLDMISGIYTRRQTKKDVPIEPMSGNSIVLNSGVIECVAVPSGFLLLKRHVLEKMYDEYSPPYHNGLWEHGLDIGEDLAFCRRWRAVGGKIHAHTGVIVKHIGEHVFEP